MQFDFIGKTTLGIVLAATDRRALARVLPVGAHDVIVCPLQLGLRATRASPSRCAPEQSIGTRNTSSLVAAMPEML